MTTLLNVRLFLRKKNCCIIVGLFIVHSVDCQNKFQHLRKKATLIDEIKLLMLQ